MTGNTIKSATANGTVRLPFFKRIQRIIMNEATGVARITVINGEIKAFAVFEKCVRSATTTPKIIPQIRPSPIRKTEERIVSQKSAVGKRENKRLSV